MLGGPATLPKGIGSGPGAKLANCPAPAGLTMLAVGSALGAEGMSGVVPWPGAAEAWLGGADMGRSCNGCCDAEGMSGCSVMEGASGVGLFLGSAGGCGGMTCLG